jgi:colanic acid/amylovoran biosynthesis glycosyltransferase
MAGPVVAVYRRSLLPASETFIRNQALALRRYTAVFAGELQVPGLDLPADRVLVGAPGPRWRRAARRRLLGTDPAQRLADACRARGVELVHAHFGSDGVAGLELARRLGVPLIITFHGFDATVSDEAMLAAGSGLDEYARRRPELFEHAALLIAVSRFVADRLVGLGAPPERVRVHHIGVPVEPAPPALEREPVVLFVGRHIEKKGLGDLVEAMARVRRTAPHTRLVVIGDGPLRGRWEARARALLGDPEFTGWLPPDAVRDHLRRARVLCVPSRTAANGDAEGLPMVIPEAGVHGLAAVGTRHSGIPEALDEGRAGLLVEEGDVDALATALSALLTDDALWRRLSAAARDNAVRRFDLARQSAELERLYDEALNRGAPG